MMFCLSGLRCLPKLWKSSPYPKLGPGYSSPSLFLTVYCGTRNQQSAFSVKPTSQNTKTMNLLITKARKLKGNSGNKQVSSEPYSFAAGKAKKRSHIGNPQNEDHASPPLKNIMELPAKPLNSEDWDKLKDCFKRKGSFEDCIISQMAHYHGSVNEAESLLAWVAAKNNGIVGYNLLVKYLYLCVFHQQRSEVIDVYEIMKARYKSLESGGYTPLIWGLIHSDRWRETLLLLEDIKKSHDPFKKEL